MGQPARDALAVGFVGEVEEQLRDSPVHVEQHEAADFFVDATQPARQLAQQREPNAGRMLQDALKILAAQHVQRRVLHGDDVRGARLIVDQCHFAEEFALAEHGENYFPSIFADQDDRSEEHTSELQSQSNLVCRLLLEKKKKKKNTNTVYARSI